MPPTDGNANAPVHPPQSQQRRPIPSSPNGLQHRAVSTDRRFIIRVGLGEITASVDEIRTEIGDRLDRHQPDLHKNHDGRLVLTLTIAAADLWISLLLAMAAVTPTGYPPQWVEARPSSNTT